MRAQSLPALRRIPALLGRVQPELVLYNGWWGKYSDSPRAIFEELRDRDGPYRHVWILEDPDAAPEGASAVTPGSLAYIRQTGLARYIVSNNTLPGYFRKKRGTTYLQTWHGTPLKRIGFDIDRPSFNDSARYFKELRREVRAWDFLVAPNHFSGDVFRNAFEYGGQMLETGYPRNDMLLAEDRAAVRAHTRKELGIADNERAVLYAPTWRDDDTFSTELDLGALAREYIVLLRSHRIVADTVTVRDSPRVRNVSDRDDPGELLLAADVLVTDYSSMMFDFAVTGKPIVFFTYDLEHYRDELRGFYFDFAADAPGPLTRTTGELIEALSDLEGVRVRYADRYRSFRARFCALEDGHATERVVDAVFGA
jgi:CDP-glycerol glycerophosphotransferase